MPVLNTPQELIAALSIAPTAEDPIAELERHGYTLGPEMAREWQAAKARPRPQKTIFQPVEPPPPGSVTFSATKATPVVALDRAPGDYDVIIGVNLALATEVLGTLYDSGTIPHLVDLGRQLSASDLQTLEEFFVVDRPGGTLSRLLITGPLTVETIADGSQAVAVNVPVQLDWDRSIRGINGIRPNVTYAAGTLRLIMNIQANVKNLATSPTLTLDVALATTVDSPADSPRFVLASNSPVQRVSAPPPNEVDLLAAFIEVKLHDFLLANDPNVLSWTISPIFPLPIESLEIQQIDVRTVGDALIAGINVVGTPGGPGNPSALVNLLPGDGSNVFLRTLDTVPQRLIQRALADGTLTILAQSQQSNAVVDSADMHFQSNAIVAHISGRLVNECPAHVDLYFNPTKTITFTFAKNQIQVTTTQDQSIADWHNWLCFLTSGGPLLLFSLATALMGDLWLSTIEFAGVGSVIGLGTDVGTLIFNNAVSALFGGGSPPTPTPIDLTTAIPGSDSVVSVKAASFAVTDGSLFITATAGTIADDTGTYLYARFLIPGEFAQSGTPVVGARASLMDRDSPAPLGDDVSTRPTRVVQTVKNIRTVTTTTYHPPTADELMLDATTDATGMVRFALNPDQLGTGGGTRTQTVTKTNVVTDQEIGAPVVTQLSVYEPHPDLYFRLTMPDGTALTSLSSPKGLYVNAGAMHAGSFSNPLTFFVTSGGLVLTTGIGGEQPLA